MEKRKAYVESKGCEFINETKHGHNYKMNIISTCGHETETFLTTSKEKELGYYAKVVLTKKNVLNTAKQLTVFF